MGACRIFFPFFGECTVTLALKCPVAYVASPSWKAVRSHLALRRVRSRPGAFSLVVRRKQRACLLLFARFTTSRHFRFSSTQRVASVLGAVAFSEMSAGLLPLKLQCGRAHQMTSKGPRITLMFPFSVPWTVRSVKVSAFLVVCGFPQPHLVFQLISIPG